MGFDRPQKIMADAQGGRLAAPAWTQFMSEVYRRKPAPPDWPRPLGIITRDIDVATGMLQTPYCPRDLIRTEFYIPGTEPMQECNKHLGYGQPDYLDTLGRAPDTLQLRPPAAAAGSSGSRSRPAHRRCREPLRHGRTRAIRAPCSTLSRPRRDLSAQGRHNAQRQPRRCGLDEALSRGGSFPLRARQSRTAASPKRRRDPVRRPA